MIPFLLLAIGLGIKHSFDPDHLLAVSGFFTQTPSVKKSIRLSIYWAAGHMLTAIALTFVLFTFKDIFLSSVLERMESLVGVMLIFLGAWGVYTAVFSQWHAHAHTHNGNATTHTHVHAHPLTKHGSEKNHNHYHLFGVGIVQGLASNDELLILLTATLSVSTWMELVGGITFFSLGVVLGMIGFGSLFTLSILRVHREKILPIIHGLVGVLSMGYGLQILLEMGF